MQNTIKKKILIMTLVVCSVIVVVNNADLLLPLKAPYDKLFHLALSLLVAIWVSYNVRGVFRLMNKALASASGLATSVDMDLHLMHIKGATREANKFVDALRTDATPENFRALNPGDGLGKSLISLRQKLQDYKEDEQKRSWTHVGLGRFADLLKSGSTIEEFSTILISNVVKYLDANQGGVFIEEVRDGERCLVLKGCYAYERKKFVERIIREGEGILGECMLSKTPVYMTHVPENYLHITSGLGNALPRNLVIVPLIFHEEFFGAIELASFTVMEQYKIDFLKKLSENIAAEVASRKTVLNREELLSDANRLAEELKAHEEEMRQHMEELSATQEEMARKQAELSSVFSAINNTVASIEFDMEGKVLSANSIFCKISGFAAEDAILLSYNRLIPASERSKTQHQMMWHNLNAGKFFEGEFRFIGKDSNELWLSGTFNPVFNNDMKPVKVIMIAQFTGQEKAKFAELTGVVSALKNAVPYLELDTNLQCKSANERFLKLFNIRRVDLRSRNFVTFLDRCDQSAFSFDVKSVTDFSERPFKYTIGAHTVSIQTSISPVKDHEGRIVKLIVILAGSVVPEQNILLAV